MVSQPHEPEHLKLLALDPDDLSVISAHLQDAIVRTGDLAFMPGERRFALLARRFDWAAAEIGPRRRLSGLHFDRVERCRCRGLDRSRQDDPLSLLAITFEERDAPSGVVRLVFSGNASIELELECVEAQFRDLGPVWSAGRCPNHDLERT